MTTEVLTDAPADCSLACVDPAEGYHAADCSNREPTPAFPDDSFPAPSELPPPQAIDAALAAQPEPESEAIRDLHDWAKRVKSIERRLQAAQKETEEIKAELKEAKEAEEEIVLELSIAIRQDPSATPGPLFDTPKAERDGLTSIDPTDESWREIHLHDALPDLSSSVLKKLAEASITTMGQLADWSKVEFSPGRFQALSDIKGIGKGTAEKIEDACMKFWATYSAAATVAPGSVEDVSPTDAHLTEPDAAETQPATFDATVDAILNEQTHQVAEFVEKRLAEQAAEPIRDPIGVEAGEGPPEPATNGTAKKGRKKGAKP